MSRYESMETSGKLRDLLDRWEYLIRDFPTDGDENEFNEFISSNYEEFNKLTEETGMYFTNIPVKGTLDRTELRLFEDLNSLRYLPLIYMIENKNEQFIEIGKKIKDLCESLESTESR